MMMHTATTTLQNQNVTTESPAESPNYSVSVDFPTNINQTHTPPVSGNIQFSLFALHACSSNFILIHASIAKFLVNFQALYTFII
jgi:hypothetical protein